jgi:hypothetical protein
LSADIGRNNRWIIVFLKRKINVLSMYKEHIESLSKVPELPKEPANVVEENIEQEEIAEEVVTEEVAETVEMTADENTVVFEAEESSFSDKFNNISSLFE